jgi:ABC-type branched-subunit amino acid transport system substrate-binding protein
LRRHPFVASVAAFLAATLSLQPLQSAGTDILLGMSAAFTGASGLLGSDLYRGAQAYFAELNNAGGVNGRHIKIRAYDDGYTPDRAVFNTIDLIEHDHADLLFGYVGTPTVTRVLPLLKRYEERGPYLLFPFTGAEPQRQPPYKEFVFNLRASYQQETAGLVDHFVDIGRRRVGVFYQADAYGRSGWDGVSKALARHQLTLAGEATYRRGAIYGTSMIAQVQALRGANVDAVISVGAYAACAAFVRDAVDAGWDVPIANVSFVGSESLLDLLMAETRRTNRDYTRGLVNSQVVPSYEDLSLAGVREYRTLMDKHRPAPPFSSSTVSASPYSFVSFEGFLDAKLLADILRRTGGRTDRDSLRKAFESVDHLDLGIESAVSFGATRTQGLDAVYYTRVQSGHFRPVDTWKTWAH